MLPYENRWFEQVGPQIVFAGIQAQTLCRQFEPAADLPGIRSLPAHALFPAGIVVLAAAHRAHQRHHPFCPVRRILFEVPGVAAINASAAFRLAEIEYDPEKTSEDVLSRTLDQAGYLEDLLTPTESGEPAVGRDGTTSDNESRRDD